MGCRGRLINRGAGRLLCAALTLTLGLDSRAAEQSGVTARRNYSKVTMTYKRVGECAIKADVYRRAGKGIRPAVMWIHGGALIFGSRDTVRPDQLQRYLDAGFVLISIDYRLAPETKLPAILSDLRDAYRWVREKGPSLYSIDPDRIAIVGNSAGGFLALTAGYALSPRPKAIVSFYGYGDIAGDWTTRPNPDYLGLKPVLEAEAESVVGDEPVSESPIFPRVVYYNYCKQHGLWPLRVAGLDPVTQRRELEGLSPIHHLGPDYPPTLLLHGDRDRDVPFEASERMAAALDSARVPHRLIRMKGYDHLFDVFPGGWPDAEPFGLADPAVAAAYDEVVAFLRSHLGG